MTTLRSRAAALAAVSALVGAAACQAGSDAASSTHAASTPRPTVSAAPVTTSDRARSTRPAAPATTSHPRRVPPPTRASSSSAAPLRAPLVVIDPGHSVPVHAVDRATGLDVSDYENEPEMRDVFAVAVLVRSRLRAAGYRVIMTKPTVDTPRSLGRRAHIANAAHAALALSIHDQAGGNGGIGFDAGNNTVYYQSVGTYRETPAGKKVYFTDARVAALSRKYATIFQRRRAAAQHTSITLLGNTGYNLGSRGLAAGNIWLVQLLSHVPWIYNEAGGNSSGMVGLSRADERRYADGLVASVEACLPISR